MGRYVRKIAVIDLFTVLVSAHGIVSSICVCPGMYSPQPARFRVASGREFVNYRTELVRFID